MSDAHPPEAAGPLAHIRVLDLTVARAGPTCTRQLADMGAEVIHVASPRGGFLPGSDTHNLQRNKRSIAIDLKTEAGHDVFLRLADASDVVVENFRSNVKQRLGIDYATLSARHPGLIYASISGFGQDGPYATRPGVDQIAQGLGGLMSVTGPPGSGPWRAGLAVSDTAAGTFLTQGVLAALIERDRSGRGQWVHTSLLESMINFMDFQATRWLIDAEVPVQMGNDHPTVFPMGTFRTADGCINIAAMLAWETFVGALDAPEIAADERFASFASRVQHREALREAVEARLASKASEEWVRILNDAGIPSGPILAMNEVFEDPQVRHLEMAQRVEHPEDGVLELVRYPVNFSETPASIRSAAPIAGADTARVLSEHGFGDDEIRALVAAGAVGSGGLDSSDK